MPTLDDMDVAALKAEIARLAAENTKLKAAIAQGGRGHTPDQFADAIQHSVDTLQGRFASMVNPTSNFALKEFRLDANLVLDISPLGQVLYRFPREGETVEPHRVNKLVLDIVPVGKPSPVGTFSRPDFEPGRSVEDIDGIGPAGTTLLQQHQLFTLQDLLAAGTRVRSQVELAALLGVGRKELGDWLAQAELLTFKDMTGGQARLLGTLGVTSLATMATQTPAELTTAFNKALSARPVKGVAPLDEARVTRWVTAAQAYSGQKPVAPRKPE
jgi:hypothetical protein